MVQPLIILGTGGSSYDVLDVVEAINAATAGPRWHVAGFLDDSKAPGDRHLGFAVLGRLSDGARFAGDHSFINVIGSDRSYPGRPGIIGRTGAPADRFATLVHPKAGVSSRATIGRGVCINYGASVAGGVTIGDQVSVGPGCVIGHDARVGEYAMLAPAAVVSGFVRVGRNSYVGAGATVRQNVSVGERALVGMGAVVIYDVEAGTVVVGSPARVLRREPSPA